MLLFIDTETTGLPGKKCSVINPHAHWPRIVELAWIECKSDGTVITEHDSIIKPDSFKIPRCATAIHGITTERAQKEGRALISVLSEFQKTLDHCSVIVGHNIDFDVNVINTESHRMGISLPLQLHRRICTMKSSVRLCNLKRGAGYKNPTLSELHQKLFGFPFPDSHRALNDARACMRCFFELMRWEID